MARVAFNTWITCPQPHLQARLRLFCLPYAGGGASIFRTWSESLPIVEICPIQLPGRERRIAEPPFDRLEPLLQSLTAAILPYLDKPFALFGHSMGGLLAFELVRSLRCHQYPQPLHLFISGCRAPQLPVESPLHHLSDADFLQELRRYNGTPEAVLNNTELMQLLLPTIRADFTLIETYVHQPERLLDCPISVFGGIQDHIVDVQDLEPWQAQTSTSFTKHLLPGDHFFLHSSQSLLLQLLSDKLER